MTWKKPVAVKIGTFELEREVHLEFVDLNWELLRMGPSRVPDGIHLTNILDELWAND